MNLSIKGHLMTRKVSGVFFREPDHFIVYLETSHPYAQEHVEFDTSELTEFTSLEKTLTNLSEAFK